MTNSSPSQNAPNTGFHLGRQPALDGIRGFAVLAVLAQHLKLPYSTHGALGVDVFFTLSGFLITVLLVEEWCQNGRIHLGHFYMRRVLRLYPALLLMLLIVSFFSPARGYIVSALTYSTNWVIALKILPLNLELGHTWTLAIEEQYYLLWPLTLSILLKWLSPRKVVFVPLVLGLVSAIWRIILWQSTHDFWRYNAGTDSHADGLLLGSTLGLIIGFGIVSINSSWKQIIKISAYVLIAFTLILLMFFPRPDGFIASIGIPLIVLSTLLLIILLVGFRVSWLHKLLSNPLISLPGVISYGLYLWQVPVINLLHLDRIGLTQTQSAVVLTILIFLICLLSYRYLEKPVLRLKRFFN